MKDASHPIFIVDDDDSVRRSLSRLIRSADMTPHAFASAEQFLEAVPLESEGCLILDICMPEMSGFELQGKLLASGSPLRIIFISAFQKPGDGERALKNGAHGFLHKPFSEQELMTLITSSCDPPEITRWEG
ncbi:MAG: response regulator [Candidatus Eremiobacteraeota bacterium]|nr:response regulator [Candidatus Eremiobacteraeota bacterium]